MGLCAVAPAQQAESQRKVEIAFQPAPGSKAAKTFTLEHALALQSYLSVENGIEEGSQQQIEVSSKEVLRLVDEIDAVAESRPTLLRRLYEGYDYQATVTQTGRDGAGQSMEVIEWTTPLVGTSVRFTWVPEEEAYGRFYDARDGLEEALARLSEDADLRALLPGKPVAVGESWSVEPARIAALLAPAGVLPRHLTKGGENSFVRALTSGVGGGLSEVFAGETQGTIQARLEALREEGGARLAVIALDVDVVTSGDQRGLLGLGLTGLELVRGRYVESGTVRWAFKGKGELLWNLEDGRFDSFRLTGSEDVTTDLTLASSRGGMTSRQAMRMAGGLKATAERSRAKPDKSPR